MKEVEDDEVPDVVPTPVVMDSAAVPVEEETTVLVEPESVNTGLPIVNPVEVDTPSDPKDVEPVASHKIGLLLTPTFLTNNSLSPQVDLRKDEPTPFEGLTSLTLGGIALLTLCRACGRSGGGGRGCFQCPPIG